MTTSQTQPAAPEIEPEGAYRRAPSAFRGWVRADGVGDFPAEAGRYHLYVSLACPWAHRTIIMRRRKGLEQAIGMTLVDPVRDERGWAFTEASGPDPLNGFRFLAEAYTATDPAYAGRISVPVLWDARSGRIVNNESADIIVMLNSAFDAFTEVRDEHYPQALRPAMDELMEHVYRTVNDGVYKAGFARSQAAYEHAVVRIFATLDELEQRLADRRFLFGERLTLADIRLFTTLLRFDAVYYLHFKANLRRIVDYPSLWGYLRDVYQQPGVRETVDFDQIKRHYYLSHRSLNPSGLVPLGPELDLAAPAGREALGG